MDRRSMERLKLDKRLVRRRGWIPPEEYERQLATLPDVADKAAEPEPEGSEESESKPPE